MKKRIIAITLICLLTLAAASAAESVFVEKDVALGSSFLASPEHYFYGLDFQRWFGNIGVDIAGGGTYSENSWGTTADINGNVKLQYSVFQSPAGEKTQARIYTWLMAGVTGTNYVDYVPSPTDPDDNIRTERFGIDYCGGFGFGAEIVLWKSLSIPIEFGFAGGFPNSKAFGYSFSTGIRYRL